MAPGLVGCITAFGAGGVAMGVDTLRSAAGTPSQPGLNSVLLVRHVGHTASSTADALETIASAQRGCPWLYPLCDAGGHCVIVEAAHYTNGSLTDFDPLHYVESPSLRALLPSKDFVAAHGSAALFDRGIFVRNSSFCGSGEECRACAGAGAGLCGVRVAHSLSPCNLRCIPPVQRSALQPDRHSLLPVAVRC